MRDMLVLKSKLTRCAVWLPLLAICWVAEARAAGVGGVWATDARFCKKIFVIKGPNVSFAKDADLYGSGFIIEGRKIKGKLATCNIKTIKQDVSTVHMVAACATDVMLSDVQLSLKIVDQNKIIRFFPSVSDMEMPYERCGP